MTCKRRPMGRRSQLSAAVARPRLSRIDPPHDRVYGALRSDHTRALAVGCSRTEPQDTGNHHLPVGRLRARRYVDRGYRCDLHVASGSRLRHRQRGLAPSRAADVGFFSSPHQALFAIVGMTVWGWVGFGALIFLAGLQAVPPELVEAAQIDGCSKARAFWQIHVPLLRPVSAFLLVWLTINSLQLFDEVYVTTKGGPLHSTTVMVYYLYQEAFPISTPGTRPRSPACCSSRSSVSLSCR